MPTLDSTMANAWLNFALQIAGKAIAAFGLVSVTTTLVVAVLLRESLLSDNPYIMGWAVAILMVPAISLLLTLERVWHLKAAIFVYVAYWALLSGYLLYGFVYAELHGPGIAAMLLVGVAVCAPALYFLFRSKVAERWLRAGWAMAGVFLVGLGGTYLAAYMAFGRG
jgi:hypothetical protein